MEFAGPRLGAYMLLLSFLVFAGLLEALTAAVVLGGKPSYPGVTGGAAEDPLVPRVLVRDTVFEPG